MSGALGTRFSAVESAVSFSGKRKRSTADTYGSLRA
jgi:hypothetical protein